MPSAVNLRPHEPTGPKENLRSGSTEGPPLAPLPSHRPAGRGRADARATAEGLNQLPGTAIGDKQQTPQQLRFVSGCSIRVAFGQFEIPPVRANSRRTVDVAA